MVTKQSRGRQRSTYISMSLKCLISRSNFLGVYVVVELCWIRNGFWQLRIAFVMIRYLAQKFCWALLIFKLQYSQDKKRKCKKNDKLSIPRLEVDYDIKDYATLYFGIHVKHIDKVDDRRFRNIKKVIIHYGFDMKGKKAASQNKWKTISDSNVYHDLALLEVDRPIDQTDWNSKEMEKDEIYPIYLPDVFYSEIGKTSKHIYIWCAYSVLGLKYVWFCLAEFCLKNACSWRSTEYFTPTQLDNTD